MSFNKLLLWFSRLSPIRYNAVKCGHRTKRIGLVSAFGYTITMKLLKNEDGSVDYCFNCIGKMTIRCAFCENPIFIGSPITLHTMSRDFQIPEGAFVYNQNPLQLVGCCYGPDILNRAGFWVPGDDGKGSVFRSLNIFDIVEIVLGADDPSSLMIFDISRNGAISDHRSAPIVRKPGSEIA